MGLYDYFFGPSAEEKAAAQRAAAQRARAQRDAQARLCQSPTQRTGTLPCGLPIKTNPCDLKDLKITERKNGTGQAPWVGTHPEPEEREPPVSFYITSKGSRAANPYLTGTIIEVTAGSPRDFRKTSIDVLIEEDYQFCSAEGHPHLLVVDPTKTTRPTPMRATKQHSITVFRKARATDESRLSGFIDIWPVRWGFQDYRVVASVCGVRKGGPAVRSQDTTIRVFPNDQWEIELVAPSLLSGSIKRGTNSWDPNNRTVETTATGTANGRRGSGTAKGVWETSNGATAFTGSLERSKDDPNAIETRFKLELKRNGVKVMGLDWILTAINALKNIEATVRAIGDAIKKYKPKVGWDFSFGVEVLSGTLKATWGFKEWLDRRVYFAYSVSLKLVLLKVSFSLAFGVDLTIEGYGFVANIEGKIEGSLAVSADVERKKADEREWKLTRFTSDIPASLTAKGMAIHDRVLSLSAGAESGFEADGKVGFDAQGFGVLVDSIDFKGIVLKGRATVISLFDVNVDYKVMQKRKVGGPLRFPG